MAAYVFVEATPRMSMRALPFMSLHACLRNFNYRRSPNASKGIGINRPIRKPTKLAYPCNIKASGNVTGFLPVTFFLHFLKSDFELSMVISWLIIHQRAKISRWYKNHAVALANIRSACQKRLKGLNMD